MCLLCDFIDETFRGNIDYWFSQDFVWMKALLYRNIQGLDINLDNRRDARKRSRRKPFLFFWHVMWLSKPFFVSFLRSLFSIPYLFRDFQSWFLIGRVVFWANVLPLVCSSSPGVLALIYNFFWMFAMLCWLANQRTSPQFVLENLSSQKNQIMKTNKLLTEFFVFTDCSWPTTLPSNICFFPYPSITLFNAHENHEGRWKIRMLMN